MSHLISRILLAILLFPLASLVYLIAFVTSYHIFNESIFFDRDIDFFIVAGAVTWFFLGVYWYLLWRGSVRFTAARIRWSLIAILLSALAGMLIAVTLTSIERDLVGFVGSSAAPLLWLVATCFIWRESREERAGRLIAGRESIVCPTCGYNLT